jgi:hypothetical protein
MTPETAPDFRGAPRRETHRTTERRRGGPHAGAHAAKRKCSKEAPANPVPTKPHEAEARFRALDAPRVYPKAGLDVCVRPGARATG